jgi:D-amino-acid oxidase
VIGLDVALILAENGYGHLTTVVAQHLPGDTSIDYTSPWYVTDLKKQQDAQA